MEDKILEQESDEKMTFRWLTRRDYSKGFPAVLSGLTVGTQYNEDQFLRRYDEMFPSETYKLVVIQDNYNGSIIGCGSLVIEKKFLRDAGTCGHIEDIVVSDKYKG